MFGPCSQPCVTYMPTDRTRQIGIRECAHLLYACVRTRTDVLGCTLSLSLSINIYIYIYMYIFIHLYMCTHMYMLCLHTGMSIHVHKHICTWIHVSPIPCSYAYNTCRWVPVVPHVQVHKTMYRFDVNIYLESKMSCIRPLLHDITAITKSIQPYVYI